MLNYIETLPMLAQLIIIFGGLIIGAIAIGAMIYRLVKYGIRLKVGPVELDATDETEGKK